MFNLTANDGTVWTATPEENGEWWLFGWTGQDISGQIKQKIKPEIFLVHFHQAANGVIASVDGELLGPSEVVGIWTRVKLPELPEGAKSKWGISSTKFRIDNDYGL